VEDRVVFWRRAVGGVELSEDLLIVKIGSEGHHTTRKGIGQSNLERSATESGPRGRQLTRRAGVKRGKQHAGSGKVRTARSPVARKGQREALKWGKELEEKRPVGKTSKKESEEGLENPTPPLSGSITNGHWENGR